MIRAYIITDADDLLADYNQLFPKERHSRAGWQQYLLKLSRNGRVWVLEVEGEAVGYTTVTPLPGLPGVVELQGFVSPSRQRQGWGTHLLKHLIRDVAGRGIKQLSYPVPDLESPAAQFLHKNGFYLEHEELSLQLRDLSRLPGPDPAFACHLQTFAFNEAVATFCELYAACFEGTPWSQPFSEQELAYSLDQAEDIQFLIQAEQPIGFVWLQPEARGVVQLEPVGIVKNRQGQGYGRWLLTAVLQHLAAQHIHTVNIGVWTTNLPARHLYQALGFRPMSKLSYLALDLT